MQDNTRRITKRGYARNKRVAEVRELHRLKREMHDWLLHFGKTGFVIGLTGICLLLVVASYTLGVYNTQQDITTMCIEKGTLDIKYSNSTLECNPLTYNGFKFNHSLYMLQKQQELLPAK